MFLRGPGAGAAYFIEDFDVKQGLQEQRPPLAERARCGLQSKGYCRLHCWLRSGPSTQRMSLPLSTLRSSSPCASWAAPLSGVCAGSATGFPRTAPTCLRAVGVTALPCPDQCPCCSWCTRQVADAAEFVVRGATLENRYGGAFDSGSTWCSRGMGSRP